MQGVVKKVYVKDWQDKRFYSIILPGEKGGKDVFYNFGMTDPKVNAGATVEFEYSTNAKGYHDVDLDTFKVLSGGSPPANNSGGSKRSGGYSNNNREDYWQEKDKRDIEDHNLVSPRQISIISQSSRKDAISLMEIMKDYDALPVPKTAKPAQKFEVITGMCDELTRAFTRAILSGEYTKAPLEEDVPQ